MQALTGMLMLRVWSSGKEKVKQERNQGIIRSHWKCRRFQMFWFIEAQVYLLVYIQRKTAVLSYFLCLLRVLMRNKYFGKKNGSTQSLFKKSQYSLQCSYKQPSLIVVSILPFFLLPTISENSHGLWLGYTAVADQLLNKACIDDRLEMSFSIAYVRWI